MQPDFSLLGCFLDLGSWVAVHELGPTSHSIVVLSLQNEGGSVIGVHQPEVHGGEEHHIHGFLS